MITIQTLPCHQLIENNWTIVEECKTIDTFKDALKSPEFLVFDGMLIRAIKADNILECSVWHDGRCHDLSSKSKFARHYVYPLDDKNSKSLLRQHGFAETWRINGNAYSMARIISKMFSIKRDKAIDITHKMLLACCNGSNLTEIAAYQTMGYGPPCRSEDLKHLYDHRLYNEKTRHIEYALIEFCAIIEGCNTPICLSRGFLELCREIPNATMCDLIRKHITFDLWIEEFFAP